MKILFTASIAKHVLRFHLPYLEWFQRNGYEVHVACEGEEAIPFCDQQWKVPFVRSPYSWGHVKAYRALKQIVDRENYVLIHCHTPMASIVTRLASRQARVKGAKVLYTAHGFHFFQGAPLANWVLYYPAEVLTSYLSDAIITINREDYSRIKSRGAKSTDYFLIPGIGVCGSKFSVASPEEKQAIRQRNGCMEEDFVLIYAAEFIPRKNHGFLVEAARVLSERIPNLKLFFAGRGVLFDKMQDFARKQGVLDKQVFFLGFRTDIAQLYQMADIGVSSSKQEGLGLNLIEEMMCGLPVVASDDRGHREIVQHGVNGFLYKPGALADFVEKVVALYTNKSLYVKSSNNARMSALRFELSNSLKLMEAIYRDYL